MVAFNTPEGFFNFRVAGVAIHNGRVLLDRNTRNNYWVLPGGHPDLMEPMADAVRREIQEEIGTETKVSRMLWAVENFFFKGRPIHELSFYFLVELPADSPLLLSEGPFYGDEHGRKLIYQWFPIDEKILTELPLYPGFLASALTNLPNSPQHIVIDEINRQSQDPDDSKKSTYSAAQVKQWLENNRG